jgi:hypothetical protein
MRALRRIATPTGIGLAIAGCSLPVDDFQPPSTNQSRVGNTDAGEPDDVSAETAVDAANDTSDASCICVKQAGAGKCKEWSPPKCGG